MLAELFMKNPIPFLVVVPLAAIITVHTTESPLKNDTTTVSYSEPLYPTPNKNIKATVYPQELVVSGDVNRITDVKCLAEAIYHEARGESIKGQKYVAQVIVNRMHSKYFPDNVCDVIYQPYQFSYTLEDVSTPVGKSWDIALEIANEYISKKTYTDALYYYNPSKVKETPAWVTPKYHVETIGNHKFYKWHKNA